ncbi:MAG: hypothetical protein K0S38_705 [Candidatus Paceibacter sp.]|jgi:gas vesicle protein|nr:hypothetical protein [Candidatus Paceibacter sp.]
MEKKSENNKGMSAQSKVLMGAGIATLAAAAAGAVFLYGTDAGKKKRKQIKSWTLKMQADVMDKMEGMKEWSEEAYNTVIDQVADKYKNIKNVDTVEVAAMVADLRRHWKTIKRHVEGTKKKPAAKKKPSPKKSA